MLAKLKALFVEDTNSAESLNTSEEKLRLACAALMVEVATIDSNFDLAESQTLVANLKNQFGLSNQEAEALLDFAKEARHDATSLHQFTQEINRACDAEAKYSLIQDMWRVAYADGHLDKYEEHIIRRAADLIHVGHSDFIRAKLSVKK